jgi:homoserine kinase
MGRGLGYSGAVRVAGVVLAHVQHEGPDRAALEAARPSLLSVAAALEGHADNAAASLYGGVVATAGDVTVGVPLAVDPAVVVWVPESTTSTDASRSALPDTVTRADAVFNLGRTAVLVAALARGQVDVLRTATEDRLHQDVRFARAPGSRTALDAGLAAGAWCGWLSGSGPTVALLCPHDAADRVAGALPGDGRARRLRIDHEGACVIAP